MPHRTRRIDPAAAAAGQDNDALAEATLHTRLAYAGAFHNAIGYSDEKIDIFLARSLELDTARRDPGEVLELFSVRWRDLDQWVRDGRITDGKTIIGLCWLERMLGAR